MSALLLKKSLLAPEEMEDQDLFLIEKLCIRDESAFETIYKNNFQSLYSYAFSILKNEMAAEEIVQNVFFKIWERASSLNIKGSMIAYLYRAVHNEALNHVKHLKVRSENKLQIIYGMDQTDDNAFKNLQAKELETQLHKALKELPEQCRTVFQLSRFEELRYREIADKLVISIKTVENHMGKALRILRLKLIKYLPLILIFIHFKKGFK